MSAEAFGSKRWSSATPPVASATAEGVARVTVRPGRSKAAADGRRPTRTTNNRARSLVGIAVGASGGPEREGVELASRPTLAGELAALVPAHRPAPPPATLRLPCRSTLGSQAPARTCDPLAGGSAIAPRQPAAPFGVDADQLARCRTLPAQANFVGPFLPVARAFAPPARRNLLSGSSPGKIRNRHGPGTPGPRRRVMRRPTPGRARAGPSFTSFGVDRRRARRNRAAPPEIALGPNRKGRPLAGEEGRGVSAMREATVITIVAIDTCHPGVGFRQSMPRRRPGLGRSRLGSCMIYGSTSVGQRGGAKRHPPAVETGPLCVADVVRAAGPGASTRCGLVWLEGRGQPSVATGSATCTSRGAEKTLKGAGLLAGR